MPTATRRKNTITKFLQDIVDDSKELVDDLIDRARDAEEDIRDAVVDVVSDEDDDTPSNGEVKDLQKALAELTSTVDKLAKVSK